MRLQGLTLFVYRNNMPDCTNGGITAVNDRIFAVAPRQSPAFRRDAMLLDPSPGMPLVVIVPSPLGDSVIAWPLDRATLPWLADYSAAFARRDRAWQHVARFLAALDAQDLPDGPAHHEIRMAPMFGGNFAATSDSRFEARIVPVHDRFETADTLVDFTR